MKKLWYTHIIEYYSAIKRNELSNHEKTQRNLNCILLNEISQSEKATYYVILLVFWKKQDFKDCVKISGHQEFRGGGEISR